MTIKIAINGFGRIGRNILRAYYERRLHPELKIVAINDLGDIHTNAHLLRYDSTHGKFSSSVSVVNEETLLIDQDEITVLRVRDPQMLPWKLLDIDLTFECTGLFTHKDKAALHLKAGAKKVIISAPGNAVDATIVYGVNHHILSEEHTVISNASCTTNCLATVIKPLHDAFEITKGVMNTIHAYTNDQHLLDLYHSDLRRARSATQSIIPAKTGAAVAVGEVLPALRGKLDGFALRVPTVNVSIVDFSFVIEKKASKETINQVMREAAATVALDQSVLVINDEPLVSIDFNHHPASAIFEPANTIVIDHLVKVLAWYDNEWGFSNRMLDVAAHWMKC